MHIYIHTPSYKLIYRIHKDCGRAEEVWGELSAAWSRGVLGKSSEYTRKWYVLSAR